MSKELTFLVILDGTPEMFNALRYAAQRSARNDGRVAILYTFDTLEFSHWKAVEDIAEAESRDDAESKIKEYEKKVDKQVPVGSRSKISSLSVESQMPRMNSPVHASMHTESGHSGAPQTTPLLPTEDAAPERAGVWAEPLEEETAQRTKGNKIRRL